MAASEYLIEHGLLPDLQSMYHVYHSAETTVLKVIADILLALDWHLSHALSHGSVAVFDTMDRHTLLQSSFRLSGVTVKWVTSCLTGTHSLSAQT